MTFVFDRVAAKNTIMGMTVPVPVVSNVANGSVVRTLLATSTTATTTRRRRSISPALVTSQDHDRRRRRNLPKVCLCRVLSPVISLSRFFGILPVQLTLTKVPDQTECDIVMFHRWLSRSSLSTLCWLCLVIVGSALLHGHAAEVIQKKFKQTDFYTYSVIYAAQMTTTLLIFISANFNAKHFVCAWEKLHGIMAQIDFPHYLTLKRAAVLIPLFLLQDCVVNAIGLTTFVLADSGLGINLPMALLLTIFNANFIPNLVTSMFVLMCWITMANFREMNRLVNQTLEAPESVTTVAVLAMREFYPTTKSTMKSSYSGSFRTQQLSRFRGHHEQLCQAVKQLECAFGIPVLAIVCSTSVGFVGGIYAIIISFEGFTHETQSTLSALYGANLIFSGLRVLLIISASQILINSGNNIAQILNKHYHKPSQLNEGEHDYSNEELRKEVKRFLKKVCDFPVRMTCCNILELGGGFLASAASNIVTYVLVLMQFRMEQSKQMQMVMPSKDNSTQ